jgi:hypothetical protein
MPEENRGKPRARLRCAPEFPPNPKSKDGIFDIMGYIQQFV